SRGSTIDWLCITETWHGDVADVRRTQFVKRTGADTLVLSRKPYPILTAKDETASGSLEGLHERAKTAIGAIARGQLKALADALSLGREQANWAAELLPPAARDAL